jgi:hypothetical protein
MSRTIKDSDGRGSGRFPTARRPTSQAELIAQQLDENVRIAMATDNDRRELTNVVDYDYATGECSRRRYA